MVPFVAESELIFGGPVEIGRFTVSELLFSLLSGNRFTSSAVAVKVWNPAVAFQVLLPVGPPSAVKVTESPGSREAVWLPDQLTFGPPSMLKPTPKTTPEGVGAVPWFFTVARNVMLLFANAGFGAQPTLVTMTSGRFTLGMVRETWPEFGPSPAAFTAETT